MGVVIPLRSDVSITWSRCMCLLDYPFNLFQCRYYLLNLSQITVIMTTNSWLRQSNTGSLAIQSQPKFGITMRVHWRNSHWLTSFSKFSCFLTLLFRVTLLQTVLSIVIVILITNLLNKLQLSLCSKRLFLIVIIEVESKSCGVSWLASFIWMFSYVTSTPWLASFICYITNVRGSNTIIAKTYVHNMLIFPNLQL